MDSSTQQHLQAPSERERALQAIAELCVEVGYFETTVATLVKRAKISEESFAKMFKGGKEECLREATRAIMGEMAGAVSASYSADLADRQSGMLGAKAIMELMAAKPSYAVLGYITGRQAAPPSVREVYLSGISFLVILIDRLRTEPGAHQPPESAARAGLGAGEALVRRELIIGHPEQLTKLLPASVYGATVAYLGQEEALRLARVCRELLGEDA
jgi:hypothetical protein